MKDRAVVAVIERCRIAGQGKEHPRQPLGRGHQDAFDQLKPDQELEQWLPVRAPEIDGAIDQLTEAQRAERVQDVSVLAQRAKEGFGGVGGGGRVQDFADHRDPGDRAE